MRKLLSMFLKYYSVFILALLAFSIPTSVYANVTYRVMSSKEGWESDKKNNDDLDKPLCTAFNIYEQDFPMYLSKDQDKTALTFYLSNLVTNVTDTHKIKLLFDDQTIFWRDVTGLSKPIVEVSLNPKHLDELYTAQNISLSIGNLGYKYENSQIVSARSILDMCLQTKLIANQPVRQASAAPDNLVNTNIKGDISSIPDIREGAPVQFQSTKAVMAPTGEGSFEKHKAQNTELPRKAEIQATNPNIAAQNSVKRGSTQKESYKQKSEPLEPSVEKFEDSFKGPSEISAAMKMEQQMINNRDRAINKPEIQLSHNETQINSRQNQTPPLTVISRSYEDVNANMLSEDERDLFESMKTKMFLLEQEKQAAKSKLTDLRQKEIEVMKINIGSKQKIAEQAEKIRILQDKLQKYNYRQINHERSVQEEIPEASEADINDVVDKLTNDQEQQGDK